MPVGICYNREEKAPRSWRQDVLESGRRGREEEGKRGRGRVQSSRDDGRDDFTSNKPPESQRPEKKISQGPFRFDQQSLSSVCFPVFVFVCFLVSSMKQTVEKENKRVSILYLFCILSTCVSLSPHFSVFVSSSVLIQHRRSVNIFLFSSSVLN